MSTEHAGCRLPVCNPLLLAASSLSVLAASVGDSAHARSGTRRTTRTHGSPGAAADGLISAKPKLAPQRERNRVSLRQGGNPPRGFVGKSPPSSWSHRSPLSLFKFHLIVIFRSFECTYKGKRQWCYVFLLKSSAKIVGRLHRRVRNVVNGTQPGPAVTLFFFNTTNFSPASFH